MSDKLILIIPACAGCCEPAGCCLYPAVGIGDDLYPVDDLPSVIHVAGIGDFVRDIGTDHFEGPYNPDFEGNYFLEREGNLWKLSPSGVDGYVASCLIGDYYDPFDEGAPIIEVTDDFSDIYAVSTGGTISRAPGGCVWTGGGNTLQYNTVANPYKWDLNGTPKSGDQNQPDGTYEAVTVS